MGNSSRQSGAVSMFAVIFAALLMTTLTIGFMKLMVREQQQATNNDLSQSAYDAALAGVEDAKRVLRACAAGPASKVECVALDAANDCKVIARAQVAGRPEDSETIIQSSTASGEEFNQAYTCVNIDMITPDFLYESQEFKTRLIPLKTTSDIRKITLQWYSQDDAGDGNTPTAPPAGLSGLPPRASWGNYTPPVMRAQVITPGETYALNNLDGSDASQTVFLQPRAVVGGDPFDNPEVATGASSVPRATAGGTYDNGPDTITCSRLFGYNGGYACEIVLDLERTITRAESANAFLRLNTIYGNATVRVTLESSAGTVAYFNGAQPIVDSTGRASNLFRRVEARLSVGDDDTFPYPDNAIDLAHDLCKDFSIGAGGVAAPATGFGSCSP